MHKPVHSLLFVFTLWCALAVLPHRGFAFDGLPDAKPEDVGLSSERLKRIDKWIENYASSGKLAGLSVAIIRHGKVAYVGKAGLADIENNVRVQDDTIFRIFSMTKPITAVALMILVEEGKVHISDPVETYLPEFKNVMVYTGRDKNGKVILEKPRRAMTIRDLLSHTSGLSYGLTNEPIDQIYKESGVFTLHQTLSEFTAKLATLPLVSHPGDAWRYAFGLEVMGRIIEVVSGMPFDAFMQTRILDPLGMKHTYFYLPPEERGRLAQVYFPGKNGEGLQIGKPPKGREQDYTRENVKLVSGGAGLVATMGDYLRFTQMLLNGGELNGVRILGPKTVELMMLDHVRPSIGPKPGGISGYGFGLGGAVLRNVATSQYPGSVGEYTWAGSASTVFWVDRKEDLGVVLMAQLNPSDTYPLRKELKILVYQALTK